MLLNLPEDILIKIIYYYPILCSSICNTFINIINNNDKCMKYISYKYYRHFNLFLIHKHISVSTTQLFHYIKSISYFFHNNLSVYEKNYLYIHNYILPKSYIYVNTNDTNDINHTNIFINFYILFYSLINYNTLSIYINKNIISINFKLEDTNYYKLYKYTSYNSKDFFIKNKYYLIVNYDSYLDKSIYLLNMYCKKIIYKINFL